MLKKSLWLILGVVCTVVAMELLLRAFPVATGWRNLAPTQSDPLIRYIPHERFTYSRGWNLQNVVSGEFNNYGYVSSFDYSNDKPSIVVIGDSYVQAVMIDDGYRLHELIDAALVRGDQGVGLGQAGADLADYLITARWASREFNPEAYIFLINSDDVTQATEPRIRGFWFVRSGNRVSIKSQAKIELRNLFYSSSLLSYVYTNLQFQPQKLLSTLTTSDADAQPRDPRGYKEDMWITDRFLDALEALSAKSGLRKSRVIFAVDADRDAIYHGFSGADLLHRKIVHEIKSYGFTAYDLAKVFRADYKRHKKVFDFGNVDDHWNAYGHKVTADFLIAHLPDAWVCQPSMNYSGARNRNASVRRIHRRAAVP